jgi:hypothetical protein
MSGLPDIGGLIDASRQQPTCGGRSSFEARALRRRLRMTEKDQELEWLSFQLNLGVFVADIFHEVDEEVRREQLRKLWERYGIFIIAAAVLIVAGVAGWRGYQWWIDQKAAAAGAQFEAAATLSEQGKHAEAQAAFNKAAAEAPGGYRVFSRFRAAAERAQIKPEDAVKSYDVLAADASLGPLWQNLAAVRSGMLLVDTASLPEMKKRLDPLTEPGGIYRHTARELMALSAWRHHDIAAVRHYLDLISADPETPGSVRARADMLSALIAANGKS